MEKKSNKCCFHQRMLNDIVSQFPQNYEAEKIGHNRTANQQILYWTSKGQCSEVWSNDAL